MAYYNYSLCEFFFEWMSFGNYNFSVFIFWTEYIFNRGAIYIKVLDCDNNSIFLTVNWIALMLFSFLIQKY